MKTITKLRKQDSYERTVMVGNSFSLPSSTLDPAWSYSHEENIMVTLLKSNITIKCASSQFLQKIVQTTDNGNMCLIMYSARYNKMKLANCARSKLKHNNSDDIMHSTSCNLK